MLEDHNLLADCATKARNIADQSCVTNPETGISCAWYHGFWPYLRSLGIVTAPTNHREFYAKTFCTLASLPEFRRVLISGSADFNMLEQVFDAFSNDNLKQNIVFVDRCPTPVALAEWYANWVGRSVDARTNDILLFRDSPFDVICTHSFMGYFSNDDRGELVRKWATLLRPGGKVVTINRIRPGCQEPLGFTPEQSKAFAEKARLAALVCPVALDLDVDEIERAAIRYAENFRIRPIPSEESLRNLFEVNGFSIDQLSGKTVSGHEGRRDTGPTTPDGATYMHIVATRL